MEHADVVNATGHLFEKLWAPYDDRLFEESAALFGRRFELNGFDLAWFRGKRCLDVGCGGGRYSIAMARLGAAEVIGVDVGEQGLRDAERRAETLRTVRFQKASVLDLPFPDASFDFVCCSGVLMITPDPPSGFASLARVVKPGGYLYILVYATEGVRWPAVMRFRQRLRRVPEEALYRAMMRAAFPANKIRTLMDDLKVSLIDFYTWEYVEHQLRRVGISDLQRWERGQLDHEENLQTLRGDLEWFIRCFQAGVEDSNESYRRAFTMALDDAGAIVDLIAYVQEGVRVGRLTEEQGRWVIIGQGHHRVLGRAR